MLIRHMSWFLALALVVGVPSVATLRAQDEAKAADGSFAVAGGKIRFKTPADWKVVPPKNNVIQHEFAGPADAAKDKQARITVSTALGGVDANLKRWFDQFSQPDGSATKDKAKVEKMDVAGQTIHFVDIPGTFADGGGAGPFQQAPTVKRENYRLLGAIIETKDLGLHFIKITGPAESVDKLKEGMVKTLKGMEVQK